MAGASVAHLETASLPRVGRYRLLEKLGAGGMGAVYIGFDDTDGTIKNPLALKVMHPHLQGAKEARARK